MSTTVKELHQKGKEFIQAQKAKEDAMTRFNRAMHEWDKALEYAEQSVMDEYYAEHKKDKEVSDA